jgi:hypothetical protein
MYQEMERCEFGFAAVPHAIFERRYVGGVIAWLWVCGLLYDKSRY